MATLETCGNLLTISEATGGREVENGLIRLVEWAGGGMVEGDTMGSRAMTHASPLINSIQTFG